jgi:hypothetical protein
MENGWSNVDPLIDEDTESDATFTSRLVLEDDNPRTLQRITMTFSLAKWVEQHVCDTHIDKWKLHTMLRNRKSKKQKKVSKERPLASNDSTPSDDDRRNSNYEESGGNSSASSNGDAVVASNTSVPPSVVIYYRYHYLTYCDRTTLKKDD